MEKGINLQARIHVGSDPAAADAVSQTLPIMFAQTNPGLQLTVKSMAPADPNGNATLRVYIQGNQDPAADFAALTFNALNKAIAAMNGKANANPGDTVSSAHTSGSVVSGDTHRTGTGMHIHIHNIQEVQDDDEDSGVVLPPQAQAPAPSIASSTPPVAPATAPQSPAAAQATPAIPVTPTTPATHAPWWAFWRRGK